MGTELELLILLFANIFGLSSIASEKVSINICCPYGQEFHNASNSCLDTPYERTANESEILKFFQNSQFSPNIGHPICFKDPLKYREIYQFSVINLAELIEKDGSISGLSDDYEEKLYSIPFSMYCLDSFTHEGNAFTVSVVHCSPEPKCYGEEVCIRRCCNNYNNERLTIDNRCVNSTEKEPPWNPKRFNLNPSMKSPFGVCLKESKLGNPIFVHGRSECNESTIIGLRGLENHRFVMLENGSIQLFDVDQKWKLLSPDSYCIDSLFNPAGNEPKMSNEPYANEVLVLCHSFLGRNETEIDKTIGPSGSDIAKIYRFFILVALIILLITAIIYFLMSDPNNVHAMTLLAYVISLSVFYFFLVLVYFLPAGINKRFCVFIGVSAHFFCLMAFAWLSSFNFDIWWTFKELLPTNEMNEGIRRFKFYALFSVSIPSVIVLVSLCIHSSQKSVPEGFQLCMEPQKDSLDSNIASIIYPNYGDKNCFLRRDALIAYLYGPLGIFLLGNFVLFLGTARRMIKLYKKTRFNTENSKREKQLCCLFFKLFLTMGICWIFELISWFVNGSDAKMHWVILDLGNICQAFAIFVIFVCKRNTLKVLQTKHKFFKRIFSPFTRTFQVQRKTSLEESTLNTSSRISRTESSLSRRESIELTGQ